jgi:energy-coupling factor transport system permease protein
VSYRRRSSPLHAARAGVGSLFCVVLAGVALSFEHPLLLGVLLLAVLGAAAGARVGGVVARSLLWGLPFALLIAAINALVVRDGLTVIARFGKLPPLGEVDVTLEATAYGGILGLRALIVIACFALHSAAVDPDELLRAFRRLSFRSALTAALATRMVPVLARDARRFRDAQRCRPGRPASKLALARAVTSGALDRAVDVAATLEVRGYGGSAKPARRSRPWSRHDLAFAAATAVLAALAMAATVGGWESFESYPRLLAPVDGTEPALSAGLLLAALLPFADRRGIGR